MTRRPVSHRCRSSMVVGVLAVLLTAGWHASVGAFDHFVTTAGGSLRDGDETLRFVSFNVPNLLIIEDAFDRHSATPWRWPDRFELADAFESLRQMGGVVARSYVITVRREDSDMGPFVHVIGPGVFNEEAFVAMDRMVAEANAAGVRVIVPLVDNWRWQGGVPQYAGFRGKPAEAFWTDREVIADFKRTIEHVVGRRNTITGVRYRDDRAILGWETGNELDAPPEWTREIAGFIKSLDPNHLVIDGRSLHGVPRESLTEAAVDVVTTHHYPGSGLPMADEVRQAIAATSGRKPFFVGEAGFVPLEDIRAVVDAVTDSDAAGVLLWSLRFRNRHGGFYWHSEPANQGRYKAFHWPGFRTGDPYDETALLALVRDAAHRIRGLEPAPLPVPRPPTILPIHDVAEVSWRGSAGSTHNVVERAANAAGPWQVVAERIGDDHRQYRPLFADEGARPGGRYWYRVRAANRSGLSEPSEPAGPVEPTESVLVDELEDLDRVAEASPAVAIVTANARAVREDVARAVLPPGARILYRPPGRLTRARLEAYASRGDAQLDVQVLAADGQVVAAGISRQSDGAGGGDYGYLVPLCIVVEVADPSAVALELTTPADPGAAADDEEPIQLSRVELRYLPDPEDAGR